MFVINRWISPKLCKLPIIIFHSSKLILKLIALDQLSKWWIIGYLKQQPSFVSRITSFFDIVYVWNYGISFGLFREYYQYSNIILIIVNSFIIVYLWSLLLNSKSALVYLGYSCIIGGAIGNIMDRIFRGAVFDFLHFHYRQYSFPAFNLADAFISIGAFFIAYAYYYSIKLSKAKQIFIEGVHALEEEAESIRKLDDKFK